MNPPRSLLTYRLELRGRQVLPANDSLWAVTFSDLITLLLCFFLTMISFGPIGTAYREGEAPELTPESISQVPPKDGTSLAISGEGVQRRVFELFEEDLSRIAQGGTSETLEEVKKTIESDSYDSRRVTITVAPGSKNEGQGERWLSIIQRLSGLQRQVFDAQPKTLLKLRISEPYPKPGLEAEGSRQGSGVPALIEIEEVSRSNG